MAERVFAMPDLGEGLEEGRIVRWLVAEGATVELNQPLVEVETAKAVVEIPSPFAGVIQALHGSDGEDVPVGRPLVTFEVTGGAVAYHAMVSVDQPSSGPVPATPPVRKLAKELGVDIQTVRGTGTHARVTEEDVRSAAEGVNVTEPFRAELGVSPLPVVVAALCRVATDHPLINARWSSEAILAANAINVGLAIDTQRGLVVAVIHDAQALGIAQIAAKSTRLAEGARAGSLTPNDIAGATIAVSNTGSYGSEAGTPILAPGTSVTLAVGVIADRALVVDGQVVARPAATLSLTFDHRVLDGAAAGRALTELVDLLQSDERLRDLPR
ncbi:MAG: 2-oxo acid dehydrogenase subunit E2 [Actinobacteria bacterium]|nr:MAG: 2-oxo acid dehydrogenase subunit E2 [Actinomycetota bacterium]